MVEFQEFLQSLLTWVSTYLVILLVAFGFTVLTFPYLVGLVRQAGLMKPNYRGDNIPAAGGLIFIVLIPFFTMVGIVLQVKSFATPNSFLFLTVVLGMGFLGLLDDRFGNQVKGFRGHLRVLWEEQTLTTGGFKAGFGALIALLFALGTGVVAKTGINYWQVGLSFFLIGLATNSVNLFDLRPGRAGKIYLAGFILILAFSKNFEAYMGLFLPILAIIIYYLPFDLQGKVMMGDVGSNILGASLGMMMVWMLSDLSQIVALIILVLLQLLAERYSFTEIINRYHWLRYLDDLGRGKN